MAHVLVTVLSLFFSHYRSLVTDFVLNLYVGIKIFLTYIETIYKQYHNSLLNDYYTVCNDCAHPIFNSW